MQKLWIVFAVFVATQWVSATPASADVGRQVRYVGIHPIPKADGGGLCNIEGPHVHVYWADKPADKIQYRDHHGAHYFVGDPVAYGWDGPKHAYKGAHPIHVDAVVGDDQPDVVWCYLDGPHFHYFVPPLADPEFKVAGDVFFYVGEPPKVVIEARPQLAQINAVYVPLVYDRPVVTVAAPVGWIGARVEFATPVVGVGVGVVGPAIVAPAAVVAAPGISVGAAVRIPMPSVHIGIGVSAPGVIVEERVKVKHGRGRGHWK